jgi:hypothetical protein
MNCEVYYTDSLNLKTRRNMKGKQKFIYEYIYTFTYTHTSYTKKHTHIHNFAKYEAYTYVPWGIELHTSYVDFDFVCTETIVHEISENKRSTPVARLLFLFNVGTVTRTTAS